MEFSSVSLQILDTVLNRFRLSSISCCLLCHMNIFYGATKLFQNDKVPDFKVSQMKRTFMDNIQNNSYIKLKSHRILFMKHLFIL